MKAHILYTIGALGWTFEGLCVRTATGHDRVVVKKALAMLDHEGILESARDPRPGFDVRLITIARSFPAADELDFLLLHAVKKWPGIGRTVLHAVSTLPTKTKHHLENLGVFPADEMELASGRRRFASGRRRFASAREDCLERYYALVDTSGVPIPSQSLLKRDSALYRAIRKAWPSFAAFRKDAGLPDPQNGHTRQPCPELRDRCIREYFALARELGALPTSAGVVARSGWLYQLIVIQWGGFPQFCEDLEIRPAGVQAPKRSPEEKRARCYDEYAILCRRIGRLLSASQLREHDSRLHKRIVKLWGAMGTFQRDFEAADFGL